MCVFKPIKVLGVCPRPRVCPRAHVSPCHSPCIAIGSVSFDRSFDSPRIARRTRGGRGAFRGDTARRESTSGRAREELAFFCVRRRRERAKEGRTRRRYRDEALDGRTDDARVAAQPPEGGDTVCVCVPKRG